MCVGGNEEGFLFWGKDYACVESGQGTSGYIRVIPSKGVVSSYTGIRDEQIMEIIQMIGSNAYRNYCATYHDSAPTDLPRFSNVDDFLELAATFNLEAPESFEVAEADSVIQKAFKTILAHAYLA